MNEFGAFAKPARGGYLAMLRLPSDAEPRPIIGDGGMAQIFPCELSATKAAKDHLVAYLNGHLRRDGDRLATALAEAALVFPRRGKPVPVEKIRRRA